MTDRPVLICIGEGKATGMTTTQPVADAPAAAEERRTTTTNFASTVVAGLRDSLGRHRQELVILAATIAFVIVVGWLGKTMVTS